MYTGNGETKIFPIPNGADGRSVFLCAPNGTAVRAREGEAYGLEGGNVVFGTPPPAGWTIAFAEPENAEPLRKGACLVVYADGTLRELPRDPWELLNEAQAERMELRKLLGDARAEHQSAAAEIRGLAAEAKEVLKARLLGYETRAEAAIAAAVRASADETATAINKNILEIRQKHREVKNAQEAVEAARLETLAASARAASETADALRREMAETGAKVLEAYERVRKMHAETQEMRDHARQCAAGAGMEVKAQFGQRAEALLAELRSAKGALDNETRTLIDRAVQDVKGLAEQAQTARDEAYRAARRVDEMDRHVRIAEREIAGREEKVRVMAERAVESDMATRESLGKLRREQGKTETGKKEE